MLSIISKAVQSPTTAPTLTTWLREAMRKYVHTGIMDISSQQNVCIYSLFTKIELYFAYLLRDENACLASYFVFALLHEVADKS